MNTLISTFALVCLAFLVGAGVAVYQHEVEAKQSHAESLTYKAKQKAVEHERTCTLVPSLKVCQR